MRVQCRTRRLQVNLVQRLMLRQRRVLHRGGLWISAANALKCALWIDRVRLRRLAKRRAILMTCGPAKCRLLRRPRKRTFSQQLTAVMKRSNKILIKVRRLAVRHGPNICGRTALMWMCSIARYEPKRRHALQRGSRHIFMLPRMMARSLIVARAGSVHVVRHR